jgi:hypothetical protein
MTLKELQQLIKEEFEALTSEADDLDVNVDADEVAAEKNPEDTLRKVFDMLKDYFEGEEEENMEDEVGEDMMDEVKDDETKNEEADLEERAAQGFGDPGAKNTHGKDAGYTPAKVTRGDGKLHEEDSKEEETKSALQERFQKLANIIK